MKQVATLTDELKSVKSEKSKLEEELNNVSQLYLNNFGFVILLPTV